jgi:hypothetical protein
MHEIAQPFIHLSTANAALIALQAPVSAQPNPLWA